MTKKNWKKLNRMQLGRYAEYYAKMEFTSYGLDVYTSEVDDHGIDFIVKDKLNNFNEIQVKSIRNKGYIFMQQEKFNLSNENLYLVLLIFVENMLPDIYLISTSAWKESNDVFVIRNYNNGQKSKPEYGINISDKNKNLLGKYKFEVIVQKFL